MNCSLLSNFTGSCSILQLYFRVEVSCKVAFKERTSGTCIIVVNKIVSFFIES